jgi:hypothetical protein
MTFNREIPESGAPYTPAKSEYLRDASSINDDHFQEFSEVIIAPNNANFRKLRADRTYSENDDV